MIKPMQSLLLILAIALLVIFGLQNREDAPFQIFMMQRTLPLAYLVAYGYFLGMLTAVLALWKLTSKEKSKRKPGSDEK